MRLFECVGRAVLWAPPLSLGLLLSVPAALAFPPYKLTDADTASPFTLEGRLGLVQVSADDGEETYASPLLRLNLGVPGHTEVLAEAEYSHETDRIEEAALGAKWIPWTANPSFGFEALLLLPRQGDDRYGAEIAWLMTLRQEAVHMHANLGAIEDLRSGEPESGWKGGLLFEWPRQAWRPGAEIFAKQIESAPEQVSAGLGAIVPLDSMDIRFGGRFGLTESAPDFTASLWISAKLPLRDE